MTFGGVCGRRQPKQWQTGPVKPNLTLFTKKGIQTYILSIYSLYTLYILSIQGASPKRVFLLLLALLLALLLTQTSDKIIVQCGCVVRE